MPLSHIPLTRSFSSTKEDLEALYETPYTGAVTTRTALLNAFPEDKTLHQHAFFGDNKSSSINSYGYSPYDLSEYLQWVCEIHEDHPSSSKPFIVSVTGTPDQVEECFTKIQALRKDLSLPTKEGFDIGIEINLSCPNIRGSPPPAYSTESLLPYLIVTKRYFLEDQTLTIGLKVPPYTYETQFAALVSATWRSRTDHGVAFLTSTNTLGSGLVFHDEVEDDGMFGFAVPTGTGGLGGATIHPLSVGNVSKLVSLLESPSMRTKHKLSAETAGETENEGIVVFGVGGIHSGKTLKHFLAVGAVAGEVATAFGVEGIGIFERICNEAGLEV